MFKSFEIFSRIFMLVFLLPSGALSAICRGNQYFTEVQQAINLADPIVQNSLAVFVSVMVARQAFMLEDFIKHVAIPGLIKAWGGMERERE
jgi:hypothetical protein